MTLDSMASRAAEPDEFLPHSSIPDCLYANDAVEQILTSSRPRHRHYWHPADLQGPVLSYLDTMLRRQEVPLLFLLDSQTRHRQPVLKYVNPRYAVALDRPE